MSDSNQKKLSTLQIAITLVSNAYEPIIISLLKERFPQSWKESLRQTIVFHKLDIDTDERANQSETSLQNAPELALKDPSIVFNVIIRLYQEILKNYPHPDFDIKKLTYFHEMRHARNSWAHRHTISSMDLLRYLDTSSRLLHGLVNARKEYNQVETMKQDLIIHLGSFYSEMRLNMKAREELKKKKEAEKKEHEKRLLERKEKERIETERREWEKQILTRESAHVGSARYEFRTNKPRYDDDAMEIE